MYLLIAGLVLGVTLFAGVQQTSVFGFSGYHVGSFTVNSFCFNPAVYNGALAVAGVMVVLGLALMIRRRPAPDA